jgi:nucleoside 2-deoxyribosyltransferase
MKRPNIYFAGSIKGGREDAQLYAKIIELLNQKYGYVLTEHIGNSNVFELEKHQSDSDIYTQDYDWITSADIVVAEVTTASLEVGYEIGVATERNIPTLCLARKKFISSMIVGNPKCTTRFYEDLSELDAIFADFFKKAL